MAGIGINNPGEPHEIKYEDSIHRLIASGLTGIAICSYGKSGSLIEQLSAPPFIVVFGFFYAASWCIITLIRFVTIRLDREHRWDQRLLSRLILQFVAGVIFPMIIILLFSMAYAAATGFDITTSRYLHEDFVLIGLLVLMVNVLYALIFFVLKMNWMQGQLLLLIAEKDRVQNESDTARMELDRSKNEQAMTLEALHEARNELARLKQEAEGKEAGLKAYIIDNGKTKARYLYKEIAYFYLEDGCVMIQLLNEHMPVAANENSLSAVIKITGDFFRLISRQHLVALDAIAACRLNTEDGKYLVSLDPKQVMVTMARDRGRELEEWILEKVRITINQKE